MSPTLSGLVAASLLLGQANQNQVIGPVETIGSPYTGGSTMQQQLTVTPPNAMPPANRPILNRIRGWFGRGGSTPSGDTVPGSVVNETGTTYTPYVSPPSSAPVSTPAAPGTADYYRRMPAPQSKAIPVPSQQVIAEQVVGQPAAVNPVGYEKKPVKSPILPALVNKIGRDEKFAWVTGQLEIENGAYVVYYATPETVDQYNGRLVLQTNADMKQFHRGDLITVEGQVQNRPGLRGGSVTYHVENIGLVERAPR